MLFFSSMKPQQLNLYACLVSQKSYPGSHSHTPLIGIYICSLAICSPQDVSIHHWCASAEHANKSHTASLINDLYYVRQNECFHTLLACVINIPVRELVKKFHIKYHLMVLLWWKMCIQCAILPNVTASSGRLVCSLAWHVYICMFLFIYLVKIN